MLYKVYEVVRSAGPDIFYTYNQGGRNVKAEMLLEVLLSKHGNRFNSPDEAYHALNDELSGQELRNRHYVILPFVSFGESR